MAKKADPRIKTAWLDKHGLNDRQRAFVLAYLKSKVGNAAAREAGYKQPETQAARMLAKGKVRAAVDDGMAQIEAAAQVDAEKVLIEWWDTYNADPAAMSRVERTACRYCHGINHEYQWRTKREHRDAENAADDALGGYGYTTKARPHPDCPECDGEGLERVYIADTRDLTPEAKRLFDGAKVNAKGQIEIVQLDRSKALESIARHLGMFKDKGDQSALDMVVAAFQSMRPGMTTLPVAPDNVERRLARMNRHITTTTVTTETAEEEEP